MTIAQGRVERIKPGTCIGHYEIIAELGHGGMGVVYRARDRNLNREVVLKCPWIDSLSNPALRARFLREVRATSSLSHPHIVPLFDAFEHDGVPWLALQFIDGRNLRKVIDDQGPLPVESVLRCGESLASALAAAHEHHFLHRDVTPRNIIISEDGWPFLTDFGLARQLESWGEVSSGEETKSRSCLTSEGALVGTPRYMSPEQLLGRELDGRSDIFSLGLVLYEMCTGRLAFEGRSNGELIDKILHVDPAPPSRLRIEVPAAMDQLVLRAIAKAPEERYQKADDLAGELRELRHKLQANDLLGPRPKSWPLIVKGTLALCGLALLAAWFVTERLSVVPSHSVANGIPRQITTAPGWEGEPAISPDGQFLAYGADASGSMDIWLVDVAGRRPIRVTDDPAADFAPAWFPDGKFLAFASDRSGRNGVWKVSMLGGSTFLLVPNARSPAISPDGNRIAFVRAGPNGEDRIMVAPLENTSQSTLVTGGGDGLWDHRDPAWSPDGTRICYGAQRNLWIVPSDGGHARMLTTDQEVDIEPAWSADGEYIYFSSYRQGTTAALWRVSVNGGRPIRVTTGTGSESSPSLSADSSRLAYSTVLEDYHLVVANLESGEQWTLTQDCNRSQPAIAPDGNQLVFTSDCEGPSFDLWRQELKKGAPVGRAERLTNQAGDASHPSYSPDGGWIAYYQVLGTSRSIWTVPSVGGLPNQVTDGSSQDIQPSWSPDGSLLAFASERTWGSEDAPRTKVSQIWLVAVADGRATGPPRRLTGGDAAALTPVFSPDGSEIAFVGQMGSGSDVWAVSVDGGSQPRRITFGAEVGSMRWSPSSNRISVSGYWGTNRMVLKEVSRSGGEARPLAPGVVLGLGRTNYKFDISRDGRLLSYVRQERRGNVWVLETEGGAY